MTGARGAVRSSPRWYTHHPKWWACEYECIWSMFVHMSNHLASLSLHKFTRLLDYTILTFCHFLPWFSTIYWSCHSMTPCQLRSPVPQVGKRQPWVMLDTNPSIEILCVQESSSISNYIISYHIYRYIHVGWKRSSFVFLKRREAHRMQEDPL